MSLAAAPLVGQKPGSLQSRARQLLAASTALPSMRGGTTIVPPGGGSSRVQSRVQVEQRRTQVSDITYPNTMVSPKFLRAFQPKEITRDKLWKRIPPKHLHAYFLRRLLFRALRANPARVLGLFERYTRRSDAVHPNFLVEAFCTVAGNFHPNSYFATADRQTLTQSRQFRKLCCDVAEQKHAIRARQVPKLLFAMANLEYRFWQIAPVLLESVEANKGAYRFETLCLVMHSLSVLNLGGHEGETRFGAAAAADFHEEASAMHEDDNGGGGFSRAGDRDAGVSPARIISGGTGASSGPLSRDFRGLFGRCARELAKFVPRDAILREQTGGASASRTMGSGATSNAAGDTEADTHADEGIEISPEEAQFWGLALFACVRMDHWDTHMGDFMASATLSLESRQEVDDCGWLGFNLYQTLYVADCLKPREPTKYVENSVVENSVDEKCSPNGARILSEEKTTSDNTTADTSRGEARGEARRDLEYEVKRACPMWVQERLHESWLDGTLLKAQPQGSDYLQLDVEKALNRTDTQASINTSVGRQSDEQHCFFAGHLLLGYPHNIALEYDGTTPLGPDRPRTSGNLSLKQRLLSRVFGLKTATIHRVFWERLNEDEKDEQILRLRAQLGYEHRSAATNARSSGGANGSGSTNKVDLSKPGAPNNDPNRPGAIRKRRTR